MKILVKNFNKASKILVVVLEVDKEKREFNFSNIGKIAFRDIRKKIENDLIEKKVINKKLAELKEKK